VWWAGNEAVLQDVIWCEWIKRERERTTTTLMPMWMQVVGIYWNSSVTEFLVFVFASTQEVDMVGGHGWWAWL
jgi:hypothetical protein